MRYSHFLCFFFIGNGDATKCFHCGIRLHDWSVQDDPFFEHARWSPNCVFITYVKGHFFIADAGRTARRNGRDNIYSITLNE